MIIDLTDFSATELDLLIAEAKREREKRPEEHPDRAPDTTPIAMNFQWGVEAWDDGRTVLLFRDGSGWSGYHLEENTKRELVTALVPPAQAMH